MAREEPQVEQLASLGTSESATPDQASRRSFLQVAGAAAAGFAGATAGQWTGPGSANAAEATPITMGTLNATFAPIGKTVYAESFRDGTRSDVQILAAAFAALASGSCLKLGQGVSYILTAGVSFDLTTKPNVSIDGQGAIIDGASLASGTIMQIKGGSGVVSTVLSSAIVSPTKTLTLMSTAGFSAGDMISIRSNAEVFNSDRSTSVRQELARVAVVTDSTTLKLETRTWNAYATSGFTVTVKKIPAMRNLRVDNLTVVGAGNGSNQTGLQFVNFDGLRLNNIIVDGAGVEGLAGSTGLDWSATNCRSQGSNAKGTGYGFHVVQAQVVKFVGCYGRNNRHSFDVDEARDVVFDGCTAEGDRSAGFSSHGSTDTVKFVNNTAKDCGGGVISRGQNTTIRGNDVIGSRSSSDSNESYLHGITIGDDGDHPWGKGLAGMGLIIEDNRIDVSGPDWVGVAAYGIYATAALVDVSIMNNRLSGYSSHGIYCKGDSGLRVAIKGNRLDGSGQLGAQGVVAAHGIFLSPAHTAPGNTFNVVSIEGNSIGSALAMGVAVEGNPDASGPVSDNIIIRDNTFSACGVAPVSLNDGYYGSRIEVWGNEWTDLRRSAIPVVLAPASRYRAAPFIGANAWGSRGVRFLEDGQQGGTRLRSGNYYGPAHAGTGAAAVKINQLYAVPFFVDRILTVDRLAVNVTAAGPLGCILRLGVYSDLDDGVGGYPGLLVPGSEATVSGAAVALAPATIAIRVLPGLYWLAVVAQNGTPKMTVIASLASQLVGYQANATVAGRTSWVQTNVDGELPAIFSTSPNSQGGTPLIQARVLS